jgi:hypothetical protein
MASARLLKSLIKPVIQRHPNLVFFDNMLFFQPSGWYLCGCMSGRSCRAEQIFLYRFVMLGASSGRELGPWPELLHEKIKISLPLR